MSLLYLFGKVSQNWDRFPLVRPRAGGDVDSRLRGNDGRARVSSFEIVCKRLNRNLRDFGMDRIP